MTTRVKKPHNSLQVRLDDLLEYEPITKNQEVTYSAWDEDYNLVLTGSAGTGKTFMGMYLGLEQVLDPDSAQDRLVIIRSMVPTRDMGFLPGEKEEKEAAYMDPYISTVNELFQDKEAWKKMIQFNNIEFMTTSFIRGITLNDSVVIVDEAQNCNFHELCSIITRIGKNCKVILCGDYYQSDFVKQNDKSGLNKNSLLRGIKPRKLFIQVAVKKQASLCI